MNVLVIATHADDEVLGCGGVMARHADRGDKVHVAVVTRGDPAVFPPAYVKRFSANSAPRTSFWAAPGSISWTSPRRGWTQYRGTPWLTRSAS